MLKCFTHLRSPADCMYMYSSTAFIQRLCFLLIGGQIFDFSGYCDNITKTRPYTAIFHCSINLNFQTKKWDIFLIFAQNIDCGILEQK